MDRESAKHPRGGACRQGCGRRTRSQFHSIHEIGNFRRNPYFANIPNIHYQCPGKHPFIISKGPEAIHYEHASGALKSALDAAKSGTQLLICDEILNTLIFGILEKKQIIELMEGCKGKTELVMTGASAPSDLIEMADYVTEFRQIKHPYYSGAKARLGIEF